MAEPGGTPSPPTPRSPFNPVPRPVAPGGGRGRTILFGCLVLLVVVGAGLIGLLYYAGKNYDRLVRWSLSQVHGNVVQRLPPDLTIEERERLNRAFAAAERGAAGAATDPVKMQRLQTRMLELAQAAGGAKQLTRAQVAEISRLLETIGGAADASPPATPAPKT